MIIALKHAQPISSRPHRLSFADKEILRKILDDLSERAIIRPNYSPYANPIVLTRKKDGNYRLCVDYRELNKITIRDNFPTELIDDNIDRLQDKRYFTILDLKDGFHHVKCTKIYEIYLVHDAARAIRIFAYALWSNKCAACFSAFCTCRIRAVNLREQNIDLSR